MWCPYLSLFHCKATITVAKIMRKTLARTLEKTAEKIVMKMVKRLTSVHLAADLLEHRTTLVGTTQPDKVEGIAKRVP